MRLMLLILMFVCSAAAQAAAFKAATGVAALQTGLPAFEKFLNEMAARDLFSGTVLITRGDETLLQKSLGYAHKEHAVPNTTDTKYNLGSINKIFTHVALLQL